MRTLSAFLGCIFGYIMLALSLIVTIEVVGRKFFGFSLQGADELGGYALAIGSSIGFSSALIERAHIRMDLLYGCLAESLRHLVNWLSSVLMACLAVMLVLVVYPLLTETIAYNSTAPSPWATPLVYPQAIWLCCLFLFAILAVSFSIHATVLLMRRRFDEFDASYGPRIVEDEIQAELSANVPPVQIPAERDEL